VESEIVQELSSARGPAVFASFDEGQKTALADTGQGKPLQRPCHRKSGQKNVTEA
jgi:hypothetical protein